MTKPGKPTRRGFLRQTAGTLAALTVARAAELRAANDEEKLREVVSGIKTRRVVQGEPYELAGKRLVFTNWYYVRPGDLDWQNDTGESVYVKGSEGPWGAHYKGVDTPRRIRLIALAAADRGEFATLALMAPGRKLRLHALTERVGSILAQVDGVAGRSFAEATPVIGDQHWRPVTWRGQDDLDYQEGQPVVLRFKLERAMLFGLQFA
jgi:hypothetical protein